MPTGSKLYLSWLDFCGYLSDFEDFVYDGMFHKMDYHMWRKLKYSRDNETQVIIEKCGNSFNVIIGHEDEYHHFCRGDESFGDFLFENLIDVKKYDHNWNEYNMPLSNTLDVPIAEAKIQCTPSGVYPIKNDKVAAIAESVKNITIDCGEALKSSLAITKDELADIEIMSIPADAGPSVFCVIDTKVDKAEFDSKLEALSNSIKAVADKYNNIDKKESSIMKGFNFDFGPMNSNVVRMSIYGLAVKNKTGSWVAYDAKNEEIMDVDVFNFDGSKFMYRMPVAINDIAVGDVIVHMSVPMFIVGKSEDGKAVYAVDPVAGERKEIMLTKSPFGFHFATKVVNMLGGMLNSTASAENPFGNMWMLMAMSDENKDLKELLPFIMMANGGVNNMNPMMFYCLMGKDNIDPMAMAMMMGAFNPVPVPAHECNCGGNCGNHN